MREPARSIEHSRPRPDNRSDDSANLSVQADSNQRLTSQPDLVPLVWTAYPVRDVVTEFSPSRRGMLNKVFTGDSGQNRPSPLTIRKERIFCDV